MTKKRGDRGRSKSTLKLLEACKRIIAEVQPITVRGVCYRLFVAGLHRIHGGQEHPKNIKAVG